MGALTKRILVAVPAIIILLAATFWERTFAFKALAVAGLALGLDEYLRMADGRQWRTLRWEGLAALALLLLPRALGPAAVRWNSAALTAAILLLTLSFLGSRRPLKRMVGSVAVTFLGVVYFGVLGGYFFRLRDLPQGAWHLAWLFTATWAYDTGGYFAGRWWGRHRLAPLASPKKSVEGCLGGVALTGIGLFLLRSVSPFLGGFYGTGDVLALSLLLSVSGQLGDLVESALKRSLSTKDSGTLLPGHGGVFDRIDSLLFNAPVLFYYLLLVK
jgi:phosphatidate cytidylyltransferase